MPRVVAILCVSVSVCVSGLCSVSIWVCFCVYFYMYIVAFRLFLPLFSPLYLITVMLHTSCVSFLFQPSPHSENPAFKTHAAFLRRRNCQCSPSLSQLVLVLVCICRFSPIRHACRAPRQRGAACPAPLWFCPPAHGCPAW